MTKLTQIQMEKKRLAMRVRAKLRLAHQEAYAEELNELLPALEAKFDKQSLDGRIPKALAAFADFNKAIDAD